MKHNAKTKIVFGVLSVTALGAIALGTSTHDDKNTIKDIPTVVKWANTADGSDSSTVDTGSESTTTTEDGSKIVYNKEDGTIYVEYKDEDGNGVPDYIDNLIAKSDMDDMFKTIFTCAVAGASAAASLAYLFLKIRKTINEGKKQAIEANNTAKEAFRNVSTTTEAITKTNVDVSSLTAKMSDTDRKIEELTQANKELSKTNTDLTKGYANINSMLCTILSNQELMANTEANFTNGNYKKVSDNCKGAIAYGEQEKAKSEAK